MEVGTDQSVTRSSSEPVKFSATTGRLALTVFLFSGMLMSLLGAVLPAWGYHLRDDFIEVGYYFLAMALGMVSSVRIGRAVLRRQDVGFAIVFGCGAASIGLLWLALASPPAEWGWRAAGVAIVGVGAGLLNSGAFRWISPVYERDPAATVNMAGVLFGLGCLISAVLCWSVFYVYTVTSTLILLALIPAFAAELYRRANITEPPSRYAQRSWREIWAEVRSPGAVLFSLLLFFQFANEWSIAGWLTIYLVQTAGMSPETSLLMLAFYWLALLIGRIAAQSLLPRVGHGKLLTASSAAALFGCLILEFTNNLFGAGSAIFFLGAGFAMIYPLVVEKIGHRFPDYHPGFYNGVLSVGIIGGFLAPWTLGYFASYFGIRAVVLVPTAGTIIVFLLILLLWLETWLAAPSKRSA